MSRGIKKYFIGGNMKVYVIQQGEYSDRHIVGVSLDKERAKIIVKSVSGYDKYDRAYIEEYDTDDFDTGLMRFGVNLINGLSWFDEKDLYQQYNKNIRICDKVYIIYAKNQEEATKIAQDMEAEYKAEKQGIII